MACSVMQDTKKAPLGPSAHFFDCGKNLAICAPAVKGGDMKALALRVAWLKGQHSGSAAMVRSVSNRQSVADGFDAARLNS